MLTQAHLHDADYTTAATELLANVRQLLVAGHFDGAWRVAGLLLAEGPWRAPRYGQVAGQLESLLPLLAWLNRQPCPAWGKVAAMDLPALDAWARREAAQAAASATRPVRRQLRIAGESWTEASLRALAEGGPALTREVVADVEIELEFLLKYRLQTLFAPGGRPRPTIPPHLLALKASIGAAAFEDMIEKIYGRTPIRVAEGAAQVPLATLAAVAMAAVDAQQDSYPMQFVLMALWLLALHEGNLPLADALTRYQAGAPGNGLLLFATWPPVTQYLALRRYAPVAGIDEAAIGAYLGALAGRALPAPPPPSRRPARPPLPTPTRERLLATLAGTPLAELEFVACPLPESEDVALVAMLPLGRERELWEQAQALLPATGRWPVVSWLLGQRSWTANEAELLFSRNAYAQEKQSDDISPAGVLEAACGADPEQYLAELEARREGRFDPAHSWDWQLERTRYRCHAEPAPAELAGARLNGEPIATHWQQERWLLDWELGHGWDGKSQYELDEAFAGEPKALSLLPTTDSWETLAYIHWYGAWEGSHKLIALGRRWQERYGAELYAQHGTILECMVQNPPATIDAAMALAREHYLVAPCTFQLPGWDLREYALGLVGARRWLLHERP